MKNIHVSISVRDALTNMSKRELESAFKHPDGQKMTSIEIREALYDALAQGNEFLPIGKCDNFDPKSGCRCFSTTSDADPGDAHPEPAEAP